MNSYQIASLSILFIALFAGVLLWLEYRHESQRLAKRREDVARDDEHPATRINSRQSGYTAVARVDHRDWNDAELEMIRQAPAESLYAQLGSESRATIGNLMGPSWIKGMRGPRGRFLTESQFNAMRDDEKEYYRRKHDLKVEANSKKVLG